jgi:hypothetical protein
LAGQPGYKSRISYSDAEYFNLNAKDARIAHAPREVAYPTLDQCHYAFAKMPVETLIDRRNKALFALLMLSGARDGAIASLTLRRIDLIEGCVHQDARDVKTKFSKTFTTYFLPFGDNYRACFKEIIIAPAVKNGCAICAKSCCLAMPMPSSPSPIMQTLTAHLPWSGSCVKPMQARALFVKLSNRPSSMLIYQASPPRAFAKPWSNGPTVNTPAAKRSKPFHKTSATIAKSPPSVLTSRYHPKGRLN